MIHWSLLLLFAAMIPAGVFLFSIAGMLVLAVIDAAINLFKPSAP